MLASRSHTRKRRQSLHQMTIKVRKTAQDQNQSCDSTHMETSSTTKFRKQWKWQTKSVSSQTPSETKWLSSSEAFYQSSSLVRLATLWCEADSIACSHQPKTKSLKQQRLKTVVVTLLYNSQRATYSVVDILSSEVKTCRSEVTIYSQQKAKRLYCHTMRVLADWITAP